MTNSNNHLTWLAWNKVLSGLEEGGDLAGLGGWDSRADIPGRFSGRILDQRLTLNHVQQPSPGGICPVLISQYQVISQDWSRDWSWCWSSCLLLVGLGAGDCRPDITEGSHTALPRVCSSCFSNSSFSVPHFLVPARKPMAEPFRLTQLAWRKIVD